MLFDSVSRDQEFLVFWIHRFPVILIDSFPIDKRQLKFLHRLFSLEVLVFLACHVLSLVHVHMLVVILAAILIQPCVLKEKVIVTVRLQRLLIIAQVKMVKEWILLFVVPDPLLLVHLLTCVWIDVLLHNMIFLTVNLEFLIVDNLLNLFLAGHFSTIASHPQTPLLSIQRLGLQIPRVNLLTVNLHLRVLLETWQCFRLRHLRQI